MWNRSSNSHVQALRLIAQIHLQVFGGHPRVYNGLVLNGRASVVTTKYHWHIDVGLWAVPQHFPLSNNNKKHLTVNYAEPQLLQLTGVEWNNWGEKIIPANCNWGVEINAQVCSCPSLLSPTPRRCHSLARGDCALSFSAQGSVEQWGADGLSLPTFPGEDLLLLHWPL